MDGVQDLADDANDRNTTVITGYIDLLVLFVDWVEDSTFDDLWDFLGFNN